MKKKMHRYFENDWLLIFIYTSKGIFIPQPTNLYTNLLCEQMFAKSNYVAAKRWRRKAKAKSADYKEIDSVAFGVTVHAPVHL